VILLVCLISIFVLERLLRSEQTPVDSPEEEAQKPPDRKSADAS
jgi:biopolymer transport protein ExbD